MMRALLVLVGALAGAGAVAAKEPSYADRPEVRAFIQDMAERHGFVHKELAELFSRTRRLEATLTAIRPSSDARTRTWSEYRALFLSEERVARGLEFWRAHREALERARAEYGVPEEVIVAIIGVETFYGRATGRWRVIDALTTLAFDYPPRRKYFIGELENYLLFTRRTGIDVFAVNGSYAGAIGIPQFMPGSYLRYAVDFDGDGVPDLRSSSIDAIGSVANFLRQHGWRPGGEVLLEAALNGTGYERYQEGGVQPKYTLEELATAGVTPRAEAAALPADTLAVFVELQNRDAPPEYRLGFQNFYVLTRYNRSILYATAVHDLAQTLRAARRAAAAKP